MTTKAWQIEARATTAGARVEIAVHDQIGRSFFSDGGLTSRDVLAALRAAPTAKFIDLRVNSIGGIVDEATGMVNLLAERATAGVVITGYVDGIAASAASFLLTVAQRVVMPSNTFQMVHEVRGGVRGTAKDLTEAAELFRRTNRHLAEAYAAASQRRGKAKTAEDYLELFAKGDTYLDADEAIAWGLADERTEPVKMAACLVDLGELAAPPAALRAAPYAITNYTATSGEGIITTMNEDQLKAQHPELHAAMLARGATKERERVNALIGLGRSSGDMRIAIEAIESGAGLDHAPTLGKFHSAAMNRTAIRSRQQESDEVEGALSGIEANNPTDRDAVMDQVVAHMGLVHRADPMLDAVARRMGWRG